MWNACIPWQEVTVVEEVQARSRLEDYLGIKMSKFTNLMNI